ncbi:MAG: acyl-CoA thioesterase [Ectothiorhodospiraceae bacterium]|nr:acyl-CoA thioesterase [Chromatiales bacterium]MCP5156444.1 acyl-CoA thioesterase [Ectothiorhodospiraceae bacterium]
MTEAAGVDLRDPASYTHWTEVTIRFGDEDRLGHVNNAAYATWLEASRVMFIRELLGEAIGHIVLARITIDYLQETRFPGTVRIGARMQAVGNRSFRSVYGVFRDDTCLATADCVNVFFDPVARGSAAPSPEARAALLAALSR